MHSSDTTKTELQQAFAHSAKYRWIILSILCASFFIFSANWYVIVPAIPVLITDTNLTNSQALSLVSVFLLSYGLFQVPGGLFAAKYGAKHTFILALIIESVFSSAIFFTQSYGTLLVLRLVAGAGAGLFFPAAVGSLTPWFLRTNQLSLAISLTTGAFFSLGIAVPIFVGPLLISSFGWRFLFLVFGICGIIIAVVSSIIVKSPPTRHEEFHNYSNWVNVKGVFKNRNIWFMGFVFAGAIGSMNAFTGFMPEFLTNFRGWDYSTAGIFTGIGPLAGVILIPIVGAISDKISSRKPQIVVGGLMNVVLIWLLGQLGVPLIWILPLLFTISFNFVALNCFASPSEYLGTEMGNVGLGLMMTIGVLGSTWIPTVMGVLIDNGISQMGTVLPATSLAWLFLAATNISAIAFGLVIREPHRN